MNWGMMTRGERDAAYNNQAGVADSAKLNLERKTASWRFREAHAAKLDLPYADKERCKWDLYPGASANSPCLIFIHGGYWVMNGREDFACVTEGFLPNGWSVALPSYSLAPQSTMTEICADIHTALDWLASEGPSHGIAGPVILAGWSAGALLAAHALDHPRVHAGMAISGIYELGPLRDTYLSESLALTDQEIADLSPLRQPAVNKEMLIAYGSRELQPFVDDSRALHAKRAAAHAPGALLPIAGADHFTILNDLRSPDGALPRMAEALLSPSSKKVHG